VDKLILMNTLPKLWHIS